MNMSHEVEKKDMLGVLPSRTYLFKQHPFFYVTVTDFGKGMGLLQIFSDWGVFGHYWNAMGENTTIEQFLADSDDSYVKSKLLSWMNYTGVKKEGHEKLTKFMAQCWPRFKEHIRK